MYKLANFNPFGSVSRLNIRFVFPQFEGPHMIHLIEFGNNGPCFDCRPVSSASFDSLSSTVNVSRCFTNFMATTDALHIR